MGKKRQDWGTWPLAWETHVPFKGGPPAEYQCDLTISHLPGEHGLLMGTMWVSDPGRLIYLEICSWRNRSTFFPPVEIEVMSPFFYELALFGCHNVLLFSHETVDLVIKTVQKPHHPFLKLVILVMKTEPESLFSFVVFGKLSRDNVFTLFIFFTNINILFSKQLIASPGCRAFLRRREAAGVLIVWLLPSVGSRGVGQDDRSNLAAAARHCYTFSCI